MASKGAHKNPAFVKALKALQNKWPDVRITAQDRARWNGYMLKVNERARLKKKRKTGKKAVAT